MKTYGCENRTVSCLLFDSESNNHIILQNCVKQGLRIKITIIDTLNSGNQAGVISLKQVSQ